MESHPRTRAEALAGKLRHPTLKVYDNCGS